QAQARHVGPLQLKDDAGDLPHVHASLFKQLQNHVYHHDHFRFSSRCCSQLLTAPASESYCGHAVPPPSPASERTRHLRRPTHTRAAKSALLSILWSHHRRREPSLFFQGGEGTHQGRFGCHPKLLASENRRDPVGGPHPHHHVRAAGKPAQDGD